jgi:hypothetical protein
MMKAICIGMIAVFVLFACSTPEADPPGPITFSRIDLLLSVGTGATGTITIELRDAVGATPALWSTTVAESVLIQTIGSNWNTFTVPDIVLTGGQTYRIYVQRSDVHDNATQNTIFWRASLPGHDVYAPGTSSTSTGINNNDFNFRVYDAGTVNKHMETDEYGYGLSNTGYSWQSFVPGS